LQQSKAASERLPGVPQVACFDTSFHRGNPGVTELIPLPRELRMKGLQRYGFHGLSYEYIASVLPDFAPEIAKKRVIVAHLGSGASLCALKEGKSIDSTLGFTALDGLCMGTRPGALDPGVVLHLFQGLNLSAKEVETLLYKKSGLLGISGISNDMRDLIGRKEPQAHLAVDYFVYRVAKEIGALTAVLGGIDGMVFTQELVRTHLRSVSESARRQHGWALNWMLALNQSRLHSFPLPKAKSQYG
jgi:acetate kinase